MKVPKLKYLYHATSNERAELILKDGIIKPSFDGIYFTNSVRYASGFVKMRGLEEWAVFKIPSSRINRKYLHLGDDHNPRFFPKDLIVTVYLGGIIEVSEDDVDYYEIDHEEYEVYI